MGQPYVFQCVLKLLKYGLRTWNLGNYRYKGLK